MEFQVVLVSGSMARIQGFPVEHCADQYIHLTFHWF